LFGLAHANSLVSLLSRGAQTGLVVDYLYGIVATALPIFIAAVFWFFPLSLARFIVKPELDNEVSLIDAESFLTVLVVAISIFALYHAVVDAVYWGTLLNISSNAQRNGIGFEITAEHRANMVATGFELAAAILLLGKARAVSKLTLSVAR
jgi:hypothetical protein